MSEYANHAFDACIDSQLLVIEVEGRCAPYEFNWTKLRHTPEAKNGVEAWVKLWIKSNGVRGVDKVTLLVDYTYRRATDINF